MSFLKNYLIDFWIWWYFIEGKKVLLKMVADWSFVLAYLNLAPMLTNLFVPLFQDSSWEGKLVAVPFRLTWVLVGGIAMLFYSLVVLLGFIAYLALPLAPFLAFIFPLSL
jgi:hypothetical protein